MLSFSQGGIVTVCVRNRDRNNSDHISHLLQSSQRPGPNINPVSLGDFIGFMTTELRKHVINLFEYSFRDQTNKGEIL